MGFSLTDSLKSIFGGTTTNTKIPAPVVKNPVPAIVPNQTVPNLLSSLAPKPAIPSFATPAPTVSPSFTGPQAIPQVKSTTPAIIPAQTYKAPVPQVTAPTSFTTPSGAVVGANGELISGPPGSQSTGGSSQDAPGSQNTPVVPSIDPKYQSAVDSANKSYEASLKISPDELSTQEDLDKLSESTKKAYLDTNGQPIPLEFITGQLKSIEQRALGLAEPLEKKLARLQAARTSSLEASKFALDRADKALSSARDATKPISGTSFYDPTTGTFKQAPSTTAKTDAGFTLQPGEIRYDANGKAIATGGAKPPSQAQETANIAKSEKEVAAQQSATQSISLVNTLLNGDAYKNITGIGQNPLNALGLTNGASVNQYNQLQGLLKLGIRSLIKGQGAVSDYEGKILGDAASSLGRNLSNNDFKQALLKIRGTLLTNSGGETNVIVKDKSGKVLGQGSLTGQDIYDAVKDGNVIEYL